jgi:translation initiation factor IF-2
MGVPASDIIKELMLDHGIRASINQTLDDEVVQLVGMARDIEVTLKEPRSAEDVLIESLPQDKPEELVARPPVVTMLGHVDHGKTSILDRIRHTRIAESEAGGITQDIGAWQIMTDGHRLTFIDTPGHEAFTAMRARGAKVTDIVVLVVAADDGVMPQTIEAINHARAAEVPIVVAVNKVDKPQANALRVRQQLSAQGLNPEEWGGDTGFVELSALTGQGVDKLLERIVLEAELLDVKANPRRSASGAVLEARMLPGRGIVTNVIVENGTLHRGDILVCGNAHGSVRSLVNDRGETIEEAGPSQPVAISGLDRVPEAGDTFLVVSDLETARKVAEERGSRLQRQRLQPRRRVTLETLYDRLARGETKQLNVVLKADVQGSLEPLLNSLSDLGDQEVSVRLIHSGIGAVNQSDVLLADAADAVIVAYRVGAEEKVREMAASRGIEIIYYNVIYDVTAQIRGALEGLLEPEQREERAGVAEVRQVFRISRYGGIAGCRVTEGVMRRNARVRVIRDGQVIHEGTMASLRQEKNDVREVEAGRECGIKIEGFDDVKVGDLMECFSIVNVKRTLSTKPARQTADTQDGAAASSAER